MHLFVRMTFMMVDVKKVNSCYDTQTFAPRAAGTADERCGAPNSPVVLHEAKGRGAEQCSLFTLV